MKTHNKSNHFNDALNYFKMHQYELAKKHAAEHLKQNPNHTDTLKLIAYIEFQKNNFTEALNYLSRIVDLKKADAEIYNLIGCICLETGEYAESLQYLFKSIEQKNTYLDAYSNLALAFHKLHRPEDAIEVCEAAIKFAPTSITLLKQYSTVLFSTGDFQRAIITLKSWLALEPHSIQANITLVNCYLAINEKNKITALLNQLKNGQEKLPLLRFEITNELLKQGETDAAIASYFDLVNDITAKESIYNNIASAYDQQGNPKEAIRFFIKAIEENEKYTPAYSNIGRVYTDIQKYDDAERNLLIALKLDPNNVNALINIGRLCEHKKDFSKARNYFEEAIKRNPNNPIAHCNLANTYHQLGEISLSHLHYKTSLSIDPNYGDAAQNLGINELAMGKFDTAWGHYFKRIRVMERGENLSTITPGMSLSGKNVYFCRSQGIGDELFFLRFLPLLREQNVTITYRASKKTYSLFSQLQDINHLINEDEPIPECDYYFAIDDIPLILNIDHINKIPPSLNLKPEPDLIEKVIQLLKKYPPPYTGITWRAGNQETQRYCKDNHRNLSKIFPMALIEKIVEPIKGSIVILQRNPMQDELDEFIKFSKQPVIDLSDYNESLDDMLALLSQINEYIGVSNTNMHLFASLGKTASVLVPFPPDWRWMFEGDSSPWFPGFEIYRQLANGDWQQATNKLITKLNK